MQPWFIEFAEAIGDDEGEYRRCPSCDEVWLPPRERCPACQAESLVRAPMPRTGEVTSFTTIAATIPTFADDTPYTIVYVDFEQGISLVGQYRGDGEPAVGDQVDLGVETVDDGWIFTFEPTET